MQDDVDAGGKRADHLHPGVHSSADEVLQLWTWSAASSSTRGARDVSAVEGEIERTLPTGSAFYVHVTSVFEAQAERAIKPEAIALGVFGVIAALATLLIAGQVIGRQLRLDTDDLDTLPRDRRQSGDDDRRRAHRRDRRGDCRIGCSRPWSRSRCRRSRRSVRPGRVYPFAGIAFDWTVLGLGFAALIVVLTAVATRARVATSAAPRPSVRSRTRGAGSIVARTAAAAGLPASTVAGHPLRARIGTRPQPGAGALRDRSARCSRSSS